MKLLSTRLGLVLGLATIVAADSDSQTTTAGPDYWDGYQATDVAPVGCAKPTAFFNCFKPVSKYAYCDSDACGCSSVAIDLDCFNKNCGTSIEFNPHDSSLYCRGTATLAASLTEQTPSSTAPANTDAVATASSATTPLSAATPASTASTATKPNAGERSVSVSAGGLLAVAAAAVGSLFY